MITCIIAVILAILIVITIMHDISIFRLERKVDMLRTFVDVTLRQLEEYALGHEPKDEPQTDCAWSKPNE